MRSKALIQSSSDLAKDFETLHSPCRRNLDIFGGGGLAWLSPTFGVTGVGEKSQFVKVFIQGFARQAPNPGPPPMLSSFV